MPIYEYVCDACEHSFEALRKLSDAPLVDCPQCNQPKVRKMLSSAGFRLKGGGWYETDFKTGSKKNLAGDSASSKSETKSETKSDSKSTDAKKSA